MGMCVKEPKDASVREKACLFEWTIKTCAFVTRPYDIGMAILVAFPVWALIYGVLFNEDKSSPDIFIVVGVIGLLSCAFIWKTGVRQKILYTYRITEAGGEVVYQLYYPKWAGHLFKGLAISGFVVILSMMAVLPGSIAIVAGVGGMTIVAAVTLMKWQPPPIKTHQTNWSRYDLVFIDRKRKMVVASYHHNPMVGFEAHMKKEQIDEFVGFLRTVIPNAEFREAKWRW